MSLSPEEVERYARHLVLAEVGGAGQQRLAAARVAVIGAGGLGSPAIAYLAAAGVGRLAVIDDDAVSLSNLQRQIIHASDAVGQAKVESAARAVAALNPHVRVECHRVRFDARSASLLRGADVVVDGSDNAATRYALADACADLAIPLVTAAVNRFDGYLTTLTPHERRPDGTPWPSYRTLFPEPPPETLVEACAEVGILGVVTGVIGALQANETLKLILNVGEPLRGRLLMFDARTTRFDTITYG